jgi:hypothetical protein
MKLILYRDAKVKECKWKTIIILTVIILFLIIKFFFLTHELKTYHAGYMYWSHPTILRDKWDLVLSGTVTSIDEKKPLNDSISIEDGYQKAGTIKVYELIYQNENRGFPSEKLTALDDFSHDVLSISGGFYKLNGGDKVLVFLTWYEGAYAKQHIEGTQTRLGIKLKSFDDPIVFATKRFVNGSNREASVLRDAELWEKYDAKGLAYRLEVLEFLKEEK